MNRGASPAQPSTTARGARRFTTASEERESIPPLRTGAADPESWTL